MTYADTIEQAIEAFHNLSGEDVASLKALNKKIQNHTGEWGRRMGGEKNTDGTFVARWTRNEPLIDEFVSFMYGKNLLPIISWTGDDEVSQLFLSEDQTKYDNVDLATALKVIFIATRKQRFTSGTMAWAFESGNFPALVRRLTELTNPKSR